LVAEDRGDQHVPAPARQPGPDVDGSLGVVEHQQPPSPLAQLAQNRRPYHLGSRSRPYPSKCRAERGELVADQPALLGVIGEGLPHVYQLLLGTPEAAQATEQIGTFLRARVR
jgi:hypothetical protein